MRVEPAAAWRSCAERAGAHSRDRVECRLADATALSEDCGIRSGAGRCAVQRNGDAGPQSGDSPSAASLKIWRVMPSGSGRFFAPRCARCGRAGASSIPPARWSRKRTSRWLQRCLRRAGARQVSLAPSIESLRSGRVLTGGRRGAAAECVTPEGALRLLPGALQGRLLCCDDGEDRLSSP